MQIQGDDPGGGVREEPSRPRAVQKATLEKPNVEVQRIQLGRDKASAGRTPSNNRLEQRPYGIVNQISLNVIRITSVHTKSGHTIKQSLLYTQLDYY